MKKVFSFLFSMLFTGILVMIFAIAIGYATFIENDFGTATAKILIYNAKWFEGLLVLLSINLIGSILVNKMIAKKQWAIFLFHIAFIIIGIGSLITRYYGFEGSMHIREGASSNTIVSDASYINIKAESGSQTVSVEKSVFFSPYTANRFSEKIHINGKTIRIENQMFMPSADENISIDPTGEPIISIMAVGSQNQRVDFNLREGDSKQINDVTIGFDTPSDNDIKLKVIDGQVIISAKDTISVSGLTQSEPQILLPGSETAMDAQKVYSTGKITFALKQFLQKGRTQLVYNQPPRGAPTVDGLQLQLSDGTRSKELIVYGTTGEVGEPFSTHFDDVKVSVTYGSKLIQLPFSIALTDFQLERYPGSNSPSSYASEVVLKDGAMEKPFRIFMNNILKYNGYRFFQSSYDTDEHGTILSVNHDKAGTSVTYFGYLLMAIGMILTLFTKSSRFKALLKTSAKLREERKKLFTSLSYSDYCFQ